MAFLDNRGDIILDAVLTDAGRKRLAQGQATFQITKFALGDDEIDYGLYNRTHASGSAYYGLKLLALPIEQAHTMSDTSQKSRLIRSLAATNLLYLPELKVDQVTGPGAWRDFVTGRNAYAVIADEDTYKTAAGGDYASTLGNGFLDGRTANDSLTRRIKVPLGLNGGGAGTDWQRSLADVDPALEETQYNITLDGRFLQLAQPSSVGGLSTTSVTNGVLVQPSAKSAVYSSGDNLKVYTVTTSTNPLMFTPGPDQSTKVFNAQSTSNVLNNSFAVQQGMGSLDYLFTNFTDEAVTDYGGGGISLDVNVIKTSCTIECGFGSITVPLEVIRNQQEIFNGSF